MLLMSCLLSSGVRGRAEGSRLVSQRLLLHYCYNTCFANETSEVSPVACLVAVAVTTCHLGTFLVLKVKVALPLELVVTLFWPLTFWPSPKPDGSAVGLLKNRRMKVVLAVLFRVPLIVVTRLVVLAEVRMG
jgi:hypothetical protein